MTGDLFGWEPHTRARSTDPDTSHEAAEAIIRDITSIQQIVLAELEASGQRGLTDYELEEIMSDHGSTYRTRRSELVDLGLVADSGKRRMINGRNRIVWVMAKYGEAA